MTDIKKLRRMLHVEHAHRVQLELGVETLRGLLSIGGERAPLRPKNLMKIVLAIQAAGREARQLDKRYRGALEITGKEIKALDADDVPELLDSVFDLNLPGFMSWLLEQRPDLGRIIRDARAAQEADENIGYGPDSALLD